MSTAPLLGYAANQVVTVAVFWFLLAGTTVTLCIRNHPAAARPVPEVDDEANERLLTAADMLVVRAEFEQMLVRKGLLTGDQLDLIRHGTRSRAVVTGMRTTGGRREDHREVVLDVMVRKPGGGQFPAHETALIPASALAKVAPGSIIDTFYWADDESAVAVSVPPS